MKIIKLGHVTSKLLKKGGNLFKKKQKPLNYNRKLEMREGM